MTNKLVFMKDLSKKEIYEIFKMADRLVNKEGTAGLLSGRTVVLFFPESSIRTRVTFEKGIQELGGKTILFPPSALDKKESIEDVIKSDFFVGYKFKKYLVEVQQAILCYLLER